MVVCSPLTRSGEDDREDGYIGEVRKGRCSYQDALESPRGTIKSYLLPALLTTELIVSVSFVNESRA